MKKDTKKMIAKIAAITTIGGAVVIRDEIRTKYINELTKHMNSKQKEIESITKELDDAKKQNDVLNEALIKTKKGLDDVQYVIKKYNIDVTVDEHNVTKISNTTLSHMQRALANTGLYDEAKSFVKAEQTYGVNAYFIAAICANESYWGMSDRAKNDNNLSGYAVYNNSAKGVKFDTKHDSIMATAKLLRDYYLTPDGECFNGYSVVDVNKKYCFLQDGETIDFNWATQVTSIAKDLVYKANKFTKI